MTPEERALLENTYALVKENNEILAGIRRRGRLNLALRVGYWVIIIGISFGAFFFIQPYIDMIRGLSNNNAASGQSNTEFVRDLLR